MIHCVRKEDLNKIQEIEIIQNKSCQTGSIVRVVFQFWCFSPSMWHWKPTEIQNFFTETSILSFWVQGYIFSLFVFPKKRAPGRVQYFFRIKTFDVGDTPKMLNMRCDQCRQCFLHVVTRYAGSYYTPARQPKCKHHISWRQHTEQEGYRRGREMNWTRPKNCTMIKNKVHFVRETFWRNI